LHGRGSQDHAIHAERQIILEGFAGPNAAAHLDTGTKRVRDRSNGLSLDGSPDACAFQIDDMEALRFASPIARALDGTVIVDRHGVVASLMQTNGLAAQKIDCRNDDHDARNRSSKARPAR
jgi:hypothetical protein